MYPIQIPFFPWKRMYGNRHMRIEHSHAVLCRVVQLLHLAEHVPEESFSLVPVVMFDEEELHRRLAPSSHKPDPDRSR